MDRNFSRRLHFITQNTPFKIAALYGLFGALWIMLSDRLLGLMPLDLDTIITISMYKGWAFIAITALLLYLLIRRGYRLLQDSCRLISEAQRESEEKYFTLFEKTSAVILLIDPDTARIIDANPAAVSFYGYTRDEFIRMKTTAISTLDEEELFRNLHEALNGPQHVERRHRLKSGQVRDVDVYQGPVSIGDKMFLVGIVHDITDRKNAERLLRDNEKKLRAITDAAADSIILVDDEMRITYWNPAAERMFGYSSGEIMGRDMACIVPERFREAHREGYRRFAACGEGELIGRTSEMMALRRDGTEFPFQVSLSSVSLMDRWHSAGIVKDISERRTMESQLRHAQKMEAIGTLTGGIAHDFNNILTAIIGFGNLTRMNMPHDETLVSYLDNILISAERAAGLTKSLLAFSRHQPIEARYIDLNEIVCGTDNLLPRLLREDIELCIEKSGEPLIVFVDPGQIIQVMMNLATNAEHAMPRGGRVILGMSRTILDDEFIRIHGYGRAGSYAVLNFSDTGIGMDEETQQRIFEPFFTTKGVGKGTGLGLSSVYGIVKQHNGFINCYSEPGMGTTFRIYLPIARPVAEPAEESALPAMTGGAETILLAEDDAMVRRLVCDILRQFGYTVIEAVDGEDAVGKFRERSDAVSLVILDLVMPKKNGRQAYNDILGIKPDVGVIFISGYPAEVFRKEELLEDGFNLVTKPISPRVLLHKVREVMEG